MKRKIISLILILFLITNFFLLIPSVNAFQKEIHDFNKIYYTQSDGFSKTGTIDNLILAVTYTNATVDNPNFRTIDYASIEFTSNPFYFSIAFEDELEIIRDPEGNIVYQEPEDGYVFLRKSFVNSYFPQNIKRLASKNINYKTITFQGIQWYRIYVPDFNRKYEWKKYTEPSLNEKWYTWGSDESIEFKTKAMFIELVSEETGHLLFDFNHQSDNSGQTVVISKSYLLSKGINNPYFEWGEVKPWKHIGYTENATHYFINPEHFSEIGIHESATGWTYGYINAPTSLSLLATQDDGDSYYGVWGDGTYIYANCWGDGIRAYSFDGSSFTLLATQDDGSFYYDVWGDGTYIYANCWDDGIRAYSFDGSSFTLLDTQDDGIPYSGYYYGVWGDGTYIYANCNNDGIRAYSFDGSSFTLLATQDDGDSYYGVWGDGTYIYASCRGDGIRAYSFDGSSFTLLATQDDGGSYQYAWGDGTYIYANCDDDGIRAYSFDGSSFTLLDTQDDGGLYYGVWGDGTYIYANCYDDGIRTYSFDDSSFTLLGTQDDGGSYYGVWGDDNYIYTASSGNGIRAYTVYISFIINRTVGLTTERNVFEYTVPSNFTLEINITLAIPVSTSVHAIVEVLNQTSMINASEVNSSSDLVNNTFWYDATNKFVHIRTTDFTIGQVVNWSVNCTYGSTFSISIPSFKIVGDDIFLQGVIKDVDGDVISGILTKTYVYYSNGSIALGDDPAIEWNCSNGNFQTTISTTSLVPGIYSISIEFTDPSTDLTFKKGSVLYLSWSTPDGVYSDAVAIFNIYNTNIGLGLPKETLQVFVNLIRRRENIYYTYLGESLNVSIKDYYNFTLISRTHTVTKVYSFIDLGITFHEYDFTNMNAEYFYASFLKSGATRWYEKVVASNGQKDFLLPTGSYTIRVYNADNSSYTSWTDTIDSSKAFLIGISGVTVIIEGLDVVDEPIEWRPPPIDDKSFIIPTKPPAYPTAPFTVLEMYDVLRVTSMPKSDAEITVVFLDTGFTSRIYGGVDLSNIIADKLPEYTSAYDKHGHGTWTSFALARIFATHLKNVRLISFKVFDDSGACTQEQMLEAFDSVKKLDPDVVSFSGGGYGGPFDTISKKVDELRGAGIVVVVAAGNYGPASGTILSPASGRAAVCVGAIDPKNTILDRDDDVVTTWSSRGPVPSIGPKPDFTAPGESIRGPWRGGQATVSGTSMATPLVAAGMAIMWGNNKGILDFVDMLYFWDGGTIPNILEGAMADTAYEKDSANDYGWGIPDFDKANDAVYGKVLISIIIWFAGIIGIVIVVVILVRRYILSSTTGNKRRHLNKRR